MTAVPKAGTALDARQQAGVIAWRDAWRSARFRLECVASAVSLALTMSLLSIVLARVERRPGVVLVDPVLERLTPRDFSWLTFSIFYVGFALGLGSVTRYPYALLHGVRAYILLVLFRSLTMMLTPLGAPPGMILLVDPFARHVVAGPALTQDLFFSGHTSTMFLLFLVVRGRALQVFFLTCTATVAVVVLWQHVHYTIDVAAAPVFAYASYALASRSSWTSPRADGFLGARHGPTPL